MPDGTISIDVGDALRAELDAPELMDRIVEAAARQALRTLTAPGPEGEQSEVPTDLGRRIEDTIRDEIREQAAAAAPKVAEQILDEGVQRVDRWGSATGEPTPLRNIVAEQVRATLADGQTGQRGPGVLALMIEREVSQQVRGELQGALDEAKAKVAAAVGAEAVTALKEAIGRSMPTVKV